MKAFQGWIVFISAVALLALLVGAWHIYLLSSGGYFIGRIAGVEIVKLGIAQRGVYPPHVDQAFEKIINDKGNVIRQPKYIHDVIIDKEVNGNLYATVIGTSEQRRYKGGVDTAYICVPPDMQKVSIDKPVDPKIQLANYVFIFNEGYRGNQDNDILDKFRSDLTAGDPAKLYLLRDKPDKDGAYELMEVVLFTNHPECVKPTLK